jgi:hypothetical protein
MFGLGHYIYAGEDLPSAEADKAAEKIAKEREESIKPANIEQLVRIDELIKETDADVEIFHKYFRVDGIAELTATQADVAILKLETKKAEQNG